MTETEETPVPPPRLKKRARLANKREREKRTVSWV